MRLLDSATPKHHLSVVMRFGLIGHPISHSKSPELFKLLCPKSPHTYELIETESFENAFAIFKREYDAVNVTAPFKEKAFSLADEADEVTSQIGATNLLIKKEGKISAYNTDFLAVRYLLKERIHLAQDEQVLVVGCGGAGKAAAAAALSLGHKTFVAARNTAKCLDFIKRCCGEITLISLDQILEVIDEIKVIIHTVPCQIIKFQLNKELLSNKTIIEANYASPALSSDGVVYITGEEWLKAQAVESFTIMCGEKH